MQILTCPPADVWLRMPIDMVALGSLVGQTSPGHPHLVAAHVTQPQWMPLAFPVMVPLLVLVTPPRLAALRPSSDEE
jgi:hypothetical protein